MSEENNKDEDKEIIEEAKEGEIRGIIVKSAIKEDSGRSKELGNRTPDGNYSTTGEWSTKGGFICLFCGGKTCRHEDYTRNPNPAIIGLHSDFVTPSVIASQRLSTNLINKYDIIQQFKRKGVKAVFNLQEIGEHPNCGDGLETDSGLAYLPSDLTKNGIGYYYFGWKDMNVPEIEKILGLVQVMHYIVQEGGKILVHCHAGLGRTGIAIACYLLYSRICPAWEAIRILHQTRRHSIQNAKQKKFIKVFALCMKDLKILFPVPYQNPPLTLNQYIIKQEKLLNFQEKKNIGMCPKLIYEVVERLGIFMREGLTRNIEIAEGITNGLESKEAEDLKQLKRSLNEWKWKRFYEVTSVRILTHVLLDFLDIMVLPCVEYGHIEEILRTFFKYNEGGDMSTQALSGTPHSESRGEYISVNSSLSSTQRGHIDIDTSSHPLMGSLPKLENILGNSCTETEYALLAQIVRLLTLLQGPYPFPHHLKEKMYMRLSISLLGLRGQEHRCFLGRRLLNTIPINSGRIAKLEEILLLWVTLNINNNKMNNMNSARMVGDSETSLITKSTRNKGNEESLANLFSMTVKSLITLNSTDTLADAGLYFGNILHGLSTLPQDMQVDYFHKFNGLLTEVSNKAIKPFREPNPEEDSYQSLNDEGMGTPLPSHMLKNIKQFPLVINPSSNWGAQAHKMQMMNRMRINRETEIREAVIRAKEAP